MKRLMIVLALLVSAGCSDILGSSVVDVSGEYDLIVITPDGANIAHSGSLTMGGGTYSFVATLMGGQRHEGSGTYSVRKSGADGRVELNPLGVEATWSNGHLIYRHEGLEWTWHRVQ